MTVDTVDKYEFYGILFYENITLELIVMKTDKKEIFSIQNIALFFAFVCFFFACYSGYESKPWGAVAGCIGGIVFVLLASSGLIAKISAKFWGSSVSAETRELQAREDSTQGFSDMTGDKANILMVSESTKSSEVETTKSAEEELGSPIVELIDAAFIAKKKSDFEDKAQSLLSDGKFKSGKEKSEFQIIYNYFCLVNGWDIEGLATIDKIAANDESIVATAHYYKGLYFSNIKNISMAAQEFHEAINAETDEDKRTCYIEKYIMERLKETSPMELLTPVRNYTDKMLSKDAKAKLILLLASLYEKMNDAVMATVCRTKAVALSPSVDKERFNVAYKAPDSLEVLAALQYDILISRQDENLAALNNLGVICQNNSMPIKGFNLYRRAMLGGEALAAANIAFKYIDIGDITTAQDILKKSDNLINPHQNVNHAKASIATKQENEADKWTAWLTAGSNVQNFILDYFDKYLENIDIVYLLELLNDQWITPKNDEITIKIEDKSCLVKWETVNRSGLLKINVLSGLAISGKYKDCEKTILSIAENIEGEFIGFIDKKTIKIMMLNKQNDFFYFNKKES